MILKCDERHLAVLIALFCFLEKSEPVTAKRPGERYNCRYRLSLKRAISPAKRDGILFFIEKTTTMSDAHTLNGFLSFVAL
ncbi:uncharacterized protein PHALS_04218 [Plasmopara halstedii]|uniref:RxLR-like protein n=1 Tax=Plasmopara halstedii TaxID=4781 RepID=A0A0P1A8H4_PLAHL|nr:uncharacterized protein PHALS_04218 [Plasmopara halstedii]CEG36969.1 hypothetical protein PHALS_04218 [Plasmopara halstedii]|eukprot:XP_024573338.1 hypothetical protein PHALS_04218 [Plasmopara halstedii]